MQAVSDERKRSWVWWLLVLLFPIPLSPWWLGLIFFAMFCFLVLGFELSDRMNG
jgi:hypothetical protein